MSNQNIKCTVGSCKFNNCTTKHCTLSEIEVLACTDCNTGNMIDESMCGSYKTKA